MFAGRPDTGGLLQTRIGWSERVFDPFNRFLARRVGVNRDDIEADNAVREPGSLRKKQRSRANDLALLMDIDGHASA